MMLSDDFDGNKGRVGTPNGNSGAGSVGNYGVSPRDGGGSGGYGTSGSSEVRADGTASFRRCRRGEGPRTELRVLINTKNAGAIIGKGGSNIKRLRESYKSSVTVPDCSGPERILTITAELGTALEVLVDVVPRLDDYKDHVDLNFDCEVRILVHQSQVGSIIGRAGGKIKELRDITGTNIRVYSQCCPMSTDRVIQITGKPDLVCDTIQQVLEIASSAGIKGGVQPYDPYNFDDFAAPEYGGFGDPQNPNVRGGGPMSVPRGFGRQSGGGGGGAPFGSGGGPGRSRGGIQRGGGAGGGGAGGNGNDWNSHLDPTFAGQPNTSRSEGERTTQQVSIPKDLAGSIIGTQGHRIRAIRAQSGAQIIIASEVQPGSNDRIITITGTQEQIQNAQYLLQMSVRQHSGKYT